jgi:hypothetical protein
MAREPIADELQELLGADALDAVSDVEREQIECYLERSPRARTEVGAFLAEARTDAPSGLWQRIAGRLGNEQPEVRPRRRRGGP